MIEAKRVYGPYARCRWSCRLGLDPVMVDEVVDDVGWGWHMWCLVAKEAADSARAAVRNRPAKDTP